MPTRTIWLVCFFALGCTDGTALDDGRRAPLPVPISPDGGLVDAGRPAPRDGGTVVPPPAPFEPVADADQWAAAVCARARRCDPETFAFTYDDDADCRAKTTRDRLDLRREERQRTGFTQLADILASGRASFDRTSFDRCLSRLRNDACSEVVTCEPFVAGLVPLNGVCMLDEECQGERFCDARLGECGTCVDKAAEGEGARRDGACVLGATYAAGRCFGTAALNERCASGVVQSPAKICGPGLFCDDATDPPVCARRQPAGASCRFHSDCVPSAGCVNLVCETWRPRASSEGCASRAERCLGSAVCSADDVCGPPPGQPEPCARGRVCAEGNYCSVDYRACVSERRSGERCGGQLGANAALCEPNNICDELVNCSPFVWRSCGG